jgi:hypothetical protein
VDGFGVGGNNHRDATASYAGAGVGGEASVYAAVGVDAHIGRSTEDVGGVDDADEGWADGGVGFAVSFAVYFLGFWMRDSRNT